MFGVTGVGLTALKLWESGGKRPRYNTDKWDRVSSYSSFMETGLANIFLQQSKNNPLFLH